jgi:hypothetical protein
MSDSNNKETPPTQLDVVATTGGKATVETSQPSRSQVAAAVDRAADLLFPPPDHTRDDTLMGEIVRICMQLDKAGFAKVYAAVKTEEAMQNERQHQRWMNLQKVKP